MIKDGVGNVNTTNQSATENRMANGIVAMKYPKITDAKPNIQTGVRIMRREKND